MKKLKKCAALLLTLGLLLSAAACGGTTQGRYRILESFGTQEFRVGFRNDDYVRYYMEAAVKVLAADGTLHSIAMQWFAEDPATFPEDAAAMDDMESIPYKNLIVGVDADAFPLSYLQEDGLYAGFDVDCVRVVCQKLGWDVAFQSMKAEDAFVELSSGNVDVAWGGLALDATATGFTMLSPYMTNELVLVAGVDTGVRSVRGLKGKVLAIDVDQRYMDVLSTDQKLMDRLGEIKRLTGGVRACFEAIDAGSADATIAYSAAVRYFAK